MNVRKMLLGTPTSVQTIFQILYRKNRPLQFSEIKNLTNLSPRTIRLALSQLTRLNIIIKVPNIHDFRTYFFCIAPGLVAP